MVRSLVSCAGCFLTREDGLSSVEYGVILALVATVCLGTLFALGVSAQGTIDAECPAADSSVGS